MARSFTLYPRCQTVLTVPVTGLKRTMASSATLPPPVWVSAISKLPNASRARRSKDWNPRLIGVRIIGDDGVDSPLTSLSDAVEGDHPPFEASHRYELQYRPPRDGRLMARSPHVPSEGPFNTTGSFTIEVFGPR